MKTKFMRKLVCSLILASMVAPAPGVTAYAAAGVQGVSLDKQSVAAAAGDSIALTASVTPADAGDKTVRFACDSPYITLSPPAYDPATGRTSVTAAVTGNTRAKIVAISDDGGKTAVCDVTAGDALNPGELRDRAAEGGELSCGGDNPPNETVAQAFDNKISTKWLTFSNTGWIQIKFPKRYYITKYAVVSGGSALTDLRAPKDWILWASMDGANWDKLDTQTNQEFSAQQLKRIYNFKTDKAYQYYKLEITANNGGTIVELSELQLFECGPAQTWALGPFEKMDAYNPILKANDDTFFCPVTNAVIPWTNLSLYNPGAIIKDGAIDVLYRAQDNSSGKTSRVGLATSTDGLTFTRSPSPVVYPDNTFNNYEWPGGCEDPRVIQSSDGAYYMYYTGYNGATARLMVASSKDLKSWTKYGLAFDKAGNGKYRNTWSKSGSVVCELINGVQTAKKINGKYWMYWGESNMFMATSDDLINWNPLENADGSLKWVLGTRAGNFDSNLVEPGPPAIYTDAGIVLIYNGKNNDPANGGDPMILSGAYCPGQALFDRNDPTRVIDRTPTYFMNPEKSYEVYGLVGKVCFVEGLVFYNSAWYLYYGTADSCLAVAKFDPAANVIKPKENTLALDHYALRFYAGQERRLGAKVTLPGGAPGAQARFISTNDDIKLSDISYDPATGETSANISSQVPGEGMVIATASDGSDAMICDVTVDKAYDMTASFVSGGKAVANVTAGDVAFQLNFNSNVDASLDIRPIIALYKNGRLADVRAASGPVGLTPGTAAVSTPPVTIPASGIEDYTVKGFIWDGDMAPLLPAYTLGRWAPPNPNLALLRPAAASSSAGDGPVFNVNDGNQSTYWVNAQNSSGDVWMTVDLGYEASVNKVVIYWGTPYATDYRIETATEPGSFSTVKTVSGGAGGTDTETFGTVTARYVRFYYPSAGTSYRTHINEFEVYGPELAAGDIRLIQPLDVSAAAGSPVTVKAETYGYYGAGIRLSASGLPQGASFDPDTGTIMWTPAKDQIGAYPVTFTVTNGISSDQKTFTITVTPVNVALGKKATSSSNDSTDHIPGYAVDGDLTTRWASSSNNNQWFMVDLGSDTDVSEVVIRWEAAYGASYRIDYATSADPGTFNTATSVSNGKGGTETVRFAPVTARYVRFYGLTRGTQWGFSFWEFEVY